MLDHALDLPGVGNARDLGGYAVGQKHVKEGVLLRTASLVGATPDALQRLHDTYHLQTVVDLRMSAEQSAQPDPEVPGAGNHPITIIEMEDFPVPEDLDPGKLELLNDPTANRMKLFDISYEYGFLGPSMYENFLLGERGKAGYAEFFRELLALEDGRALLWHCTDGKDRTGCAAMLVLSALGASRQTVIEDYLLTNDYNAAMLEAVRQRVASYPMSDDKRNALLFMSGGVSQNYMEHVFDVLDERYGGVEGYLRDELGVGEAQREQLRSMFLV